jgi:hypothetical protein
MACQCMWMCRLCQCNRMCRLCKILCDSQESCGRHTHVETLNIYLKVLRNLLEQIIMLRLVETFWDSLKLVETRWNLLRLVETTSWIPIDFLNPHRHLENSHFYKLLRLLQSSETSWIPSDFLNPQRLLETIIFANSLEFSNLEYTHYIGLHILWHDGVTPRQPTLKPSLLVRPRLEHLIECMNTEMT